MFPATCPRPFLVLALAHNGTYVDAIMRQMRHEVVLVANKKGIPLKEEFKAGKWLPSQRYSTLQDLDAHRHTE